MRCSHVRTEPKGREVANRGHKDPSRGRQGVRTEEVEVYYLEATPREKEAEWREETRPGLWNPGESGLVGGLSLAAKPCSWPDLHPFCCTPSRSPGLPMSGSEGNCPGPGQK